ncbi:unnamed protein product, partial [Prorocentrum cordatum]
GILALQRAEEHPLIAAARGDPAALEAAERRAQPPKRLLFALQQRLDEAQSSAAQGEAALAEALATMERLRAGADLANSDTALVGLQALLSAAPARVASGQDVDVLEAIHSQGLAMSAAFPAASALLPSAAAPAAAAAAVPASAAVPAAAAFRA